MNNKSCPRIRMTVRNIREMTKKSKKTLSLKLYLCNHSVRHLCDMKKVYFTFFLFFSLVYSYAQTDIKQEFDSLYQLLPSREGIEKIRLYDQIYQMADYSVPPDEYGETENNTRIILNKFYINIQYANAYLANDEPDKAEPYIIHCEPYLPSLSDHAYIMFYDAQSTLFYKRE